MQDANQQVRISRQLIESRQNSNSGCAGGLMTWALWPGTLTTNRTYTS
jgi:hypothetical protein